jgi:hypothetical protein
MYAYQVEASKEDFAASATSETMTEMGVIVRDTKDGFEWEMGIKGRSIHSFQNKTDL